LNYPPRTLRQGFLAGLAPLNTELAAARQVVFSTDMPEEPETPFHFEPDTALIRELAATSLTDKD
jgi:hypothetical protein